MAGVLIRALHRVVAVPVVYEAAQRAAGSRVAARRLAAAIASLPPGGTAVDVGGGTGLYRRAWPPPWRYVCLDNDLQKLRGFRQPLEGDARLLADATALPLRDASVEMVASIAVSHHLSDDALERALREAGRVLRPGGTLVFLDPVWRPRRAPSRLLWRVDRGAHPRTREALLEVIGSHYEIARVETFRSIHEVLLCLARRRPAPAAPVGASAARALAPSNDTVTRDG